jgi:hypothetical protein
MLPLNFKFQKFQNVFFSKFVQLLLNIIQILLKFIFQQCNLDMPNLNISVLKNNYVNFL